MPALHIIIIFTGASHILIIITGASHISQLLNVTHTLEVLHLSGNTIGDDGMAEISEALCHNTHLKLTELWVSQCGLSAKGNEYVSKFLKSPNRPSVTLCCHAH